MSTTKTVPSKALWLLIEELFKTSYLELKPLEDWPEEITGFSYEDLNAQVAKLPVNEYTNLTQGQEGIDGICLIKTYGLGFLDHFLDEVLEGFVGTGLFICEDDLP